MPQTADVFISYSREDKDRVSELAQNLRESGVSLWIDQGGIDGAAMWSEQIVNALENAKVLLLMVSEHSVHSHNVVKEVTIASERKGHILPIHLEPTRIPAALKYALAGIQHIEYFQGNPAENLKTIVRSLERIGVTILPPETASSAMHAAVGGLLPSEAVSHSMHSTELSIEGRAVAVIPFDNLSPDSDTDYFSDGLTEELINTLSSVSEIEVVSRMTSGQYKATKKDALTIGREIGARYIIGGGVRKFQDNIRISARLVDASSNREIWAQTYKGKLDDIFDIQEQVAKQIAETLKVKLSVAEKVTLKKRATENAEAYDLYLRGKDYLYRFTKRDVEYAIKIFERAIELDPRYAAAYAGCSEAYGQMYHMFDRREDYKEKAQELSLKALMYDNTLPEAYATLGLSYYFRQQFEEARESCEIAIRLDPDNFLPYWLLGRILYSQDRYAEALVLFKKVLSIKHDFHTTYGDLIRCSDALGDVQGALEAVNTLLLFMPSYIVQHPDDGRAHMIYAVNLARVGRAEEAKQEGQKATELSPSDPLMMYNAACLYGQLGEVRLSISALRDAIESGNHNYEWMKRDSDLDSIRNDPEYIELMKDK
jgi:TolB-like protein/Flp pilus assembly protein TadD